MQKIISKIKQYMFPESLLDEKELKLFRKEENKKIRDHIILLSALIVFIYPSYYFFYDFTYNNPNKGNFWLIFRFGSAISALISIIFYYKYKNLLSKLYKLPFLLLSSLVMVGQAMTSLHSPTTTIFMTYIILMTIIYTAKLKPLHNLIFSILSLSTIYYYLTLSGRPSHLLLSNTTVTLVIITLFSLRNYTSIRYFKQMNDLNNKLIKKNIFLKQTQEQLVHDVKTPLMALKYISSKEQGENLLKSATERVENIILDLESDNSKKSEGFNLALSINNIVKESKIKYKQMLKEVQLISNYGKKVKNYKFKSMDKTVFSRIVSNLINNAFEAKNSKNHKINLSVDIINSELVLVITDNGVGVSEEELNKITKIGYSSKGKGRGFGLSYAKSEIEKAGGKFSVNSDNGFLVKLSLQVINHG